MTEISMSFTTPDTLAHIDVDTDNIALIQFLNEIGTKGESAMTNYLRANTSKISYRDYYNNKWRYRTPTNERDAMSRYLSEDGHDAIYDIPRINKVIFNDPATIVFWGDGTKTVVKVGGDDIFNPEVGLAMCIVKKLFGNENDFHQIFKKFIKPEDHPSNEVESLYPTICNPLKDVNKAFEDFVNNIFNNK